MKKKATQLLVLLLSLFMIACGKDGGGRQVAVGGGNPAGNPNGQQLTHNLEQITSEVDADYTRVQINFPVYGNPNIDQMVRGLLFPNTTPSYSILGVHSMVLNLSLNKMNNQSAIVDQAYLQQNYTQFQMYLRFDDQYSNSGQPSIFFGLGKGTVRSYSANGNNIRIEFGDNYGIVKLELQNGQATLSYTNSGQPEQVLGTAQGVYL